MSESANRERRQALERLLEAAHQTGKTVTNEQLAQHLGVSTKTIQRDRKVLEEAGWQPAQPMSREAMEALYDQNLSTVQLIDNGLKRLTIELEALHAEMGFDDDKCPTCGRKKLELNALMLQAKFKGEDSFNNQVTTRAKLLGELIENHVITVQQRDEDVADMLQGIAEIHTVEFADLIKAKALVLEDGSVDVEAVTEALMRRILNNFKSKSARRAARLPSARQILDGVIVERGE